MSQPKNKARVYLVGAGPGDPDLLTLRAARLLATADIVVYDRLVSQEVLDLVPARAKRIFAGKASREHVMPQETINELLASLAQNGKQVVRLKGGDPFLFGRGSEEALHLASRGVAFEIVPGINAAAGCAAYAGIPLTHRGMATSVQFFTGHTRDSASDDLDWDRLADPEATLVIYMGLSKIARICRKLVEAGLSPQTPAAAIESGTLPGQRVVLATLTDLSEQVTRNGMASPVLFVVGAVVSLAEKLNWRIEGRP